MKKLLKLVLPVVLVVGLYFGFKEYNKVESAPSAVIELKFETAADGEFFSKEYKLKDENTLGDLFDTQVSKDLELGLDGEKGSEWGRFISGVNEFVTTDMSTGPWWTSASDTNPDCLSLGFCNGIDQQGMVDGDVFVFTFE